MDHANAQDFWAALWLAWVYACAFETWLEIMFACVPLATVGFMGTEQENGFNKDLSSAKWIQQQKGVMRLRVNVREWL